MLRRHSTPALFRVFALILAALFLNSSTLDALALERCPHHGAAALGAAAHAAASHAEEVTAEAGGHQDHGAGHQKVATASTDGGADAETPEHGQCTCLGDCAGITALEAPPARVVMASATTTTEPTAANSHEAARASQHLELLPYSNAPPAH